mmetsp:Transcript_14287/g.37995  ORF Transcript_14287/g.37995 Transcript_14287/m.37995 type:complete len:80 (+) Transcript_14287:539-778(+)
MPLSPPPTITSGALQPNPSSTDPPTHHPWQSHLIHSSRQTPPGYRRNLQRAGITGLLDSAHSSPPNLSPLIPLPVLPLL